MSIGAKDCKTKQNMKNNPSFTHINSQSPKINNTQSLHYIAHKCGIPASLLLILDIFPHPAQISRPFMLYTWPARKAFVYVILSVITFAYVVFHARYT